MQKILNIRGSYNLDYRTLETEIEKRTFENKNDLIEYLKELHIPAPMQALKTIAAARAKKKKATLKGKVNAELLKNFKRDYSFISFTQKDVLGIASTL